MGMTFYWSKLNLLNRTCLIRNRNCLLFTSTWLHPWLSGGVCVAQLFSFLVFFVLNTIPRGRNCWHFTSTWAHSLIICEVCITHSFLSCVYCFVCLRSCLESNVARFWFVHSWLPLRLSPTCTEFIISMKNNNLCKGPN
jgi:hypothetical protein